MIFEEKSSISTRLDYVVVYIHRKKEIRIKKYMYSTYQSSKIVSTP